MGCACIRSHLKQFIFPKIPFFPNIFIILLFNTSDPVNNILQIFLAFEKTQL